MTTDTQPDLMLIDPAHGGEKPYPSHAAQWRSYHGKKAWLFNPWTTKPRDPSDIGTDPFGLLIARAQDVFVVGTIKANKVVTEEVFNRLMAQVWGEIPPQNWALWPDGRFKSEQPACTCGEAIKWYGHCDPKYCPKARLDTASGNAAGAYPDPLK